MWLVVFSTLNLGLKRINEWRNSKHQFPTWLNQQAVDIQKYNMCFNICQRGLLCIFHMKRLNVLLFPVIRKIHL